jgi:hypothetical protein
MVLEVSRLRIVITYKQRIMEYERNPSKAESIKRLQSVKNGSYCQPVSVEKLLPLPLMKVFLFVLCFVASISACGKFGHASCALTWTISGAVRLLATPY